MILGFIEKENQIREETTKQQIIEKEVAVKEKADSHECLKKEITELFDAKVFFELTSVANLFSF